MPRYTRNGNVISVSQINAELEKIEQAFVDLLSRQGDTPNAMSAPLDMNGNRVLNHPEPLAPTDLVRLKDLALVAEDGTNLQEFFSNQLGILLGSQLGILPSNSAEANTEAMEAAQVKAQSEGKPIYLLPAVYPINEFNLRGGVKVVSLGEGDIEFRSTNAPIIRLKGGDIHDGTEFHGTLHCTGSKDIEANGLLLMDGDGTIVENVNFDNIKFKSPNFGCNGALIVAGNSANTNQSWIKKWSMRGAVFENCGRMGAEFLNQTTPATITDVTIGEAATFSATGLFNENGRTVLIEGLTGNSVIQSINERYFILHNVDTLAGTFQLKTASGELVSTLGGSYTSGGILRVSRAENIDLSYSFFKKTGSVNPALGMGFSGDKSLINVDLSHTVYEDTPQYGAELVGLWGAKLIGATWKNCTGEPISTSNAFGYDNRIQNCLTVGTAAERVFINRQKRMKWSDNEFNLKGEASFTFVSVSEIQGGAIRTEGTVAAIFDQSADNYIHDIVLDNSKSSNNFSTLRFFAATSTGNLVKNITILKGTGGARISEVGGAAGNVIRDYRVSESGDFNLGITVPEPSTSFGSVANFARIPYSSVRQLNNYAGGSGYISYRIKHLVSSGEGQKQALFKFSWNARINQNPLGGQFALSFGTASDFDATPKFWQQGDTVTLEAVQFDSDGFPFWDVTLPTNNASLITLAEALVKDDEEAAEFEITITF